MRTTHTHVDFRNLQQQAREAGVPEAEVNMACDMEDLRVAMARMQPTSAIDPTGSISKDFERQQSEDIEAFR